jgi:threonine synthase
VTVASLAQMIERGTLDRSAPTVAIISGHGLKTLDAVVGTATATATIAPRFADAEAALAGRELAGAPR